MTAGSAARADQLVDLGRYPEALAVLAPLIAAEPDDARLHALRARALLGKDDEPRALRAANVVVRLRPDGEYGHRLRSLALNRLGFHDQAVSAATEAVRLAPHSWQAHHSLASALSSRSPSDRAAELAADRAVELAPDVPETHFLRGLVAQRRGARAEARAAYVRTLALQPHHAAALNNIATLDRGRAGRQLRGYTAALRADPQLATSQQNLAVVARLLVMQVFGVAVIGADVAAVANLVTGRGGSPGGIVIGVALLAALAALVVRVGRVTSRGVARFVLARMVSRKNLAYVVAALALLGLALFLAWVPVSSHFLEGLYPVGWVLVWSSIFTFRMAVRLWGTLDNQ